MATKTIKKKQTAPQPQQCSFVDCKLKALGRNFCNKHRNGVLNLCAVTGCRRPCSSERALGLGSFCYKHGHGSVSELVRRLKRDHNLRARMLPTVAGEQNNVCIGPMLTCLEIEDGEATSRCPFQGRPVPTDMQQLDHIVPHSETQDDRRENLQMLCSCCHSAKSAMEATERAEFRQSHLFN